MAWGSFSALGSTKERELITNNETAERFAQPGSVPIIVIIAQTEPESESC
jgi:hypothetical protein